MDGICDREIDSAEECERNQEALHWGTYRPESMPRKMVKYNSGERKLVHRSLGTVSRALIAGIFLCFR